MGLIRWLVGIVFFVVGSAFQAPWHSLRVDLRVSYDNKNGDEGKQADRKNSMPLTELSRRQEAAGNMKQLATPYLLGETINKAAIVFIGFWFLLDLLGYGLVNDGTGLRIDTKEVAEMQRQINKTKPR